MIKIAICDDETVMCEKLKLTVSSILEKWNEECRIVCFTSAAGLLWGSLDYDLLFLDIRMPGIDGMKAAEGLRERGFSGELIFVTAFSEYMPEAFEVEAFNYLLKPLEPERFCRVFEDACREVKRLESAGGGQLFFQTKTRSFVVQKDEILYVESLRRKVEIHTQRENIIVYATMKVLAERLGEEFFRCHRGYLVNLAYVAEYGTGTIQLQNGETVYLAREKYTEFVKAYTRYLKTM